MNILAGVYISRATYIRQGEQSLDTFYSPWHLVEYYRYIRFFPDGSFSLLLKCSIEYCYLFFFLGIVLIYTSGKSTARERT